MYLNESKVKIAQNTCNTLLVEQTISSILPKALQTFPPLYPVYLSASFKFQIMSLSLESSCHGSCTGQIGSIFFGILACSVFPKMSSIVCMEMDLSMKVQNCLLVAIVVWAHTSCRLLCAWLR